MSVQWNLSSTISTPNKGIIYKVKYAPEGDLLAAACNDGCVYIYSTQQQQSSGMLSGRSSQGQQQNAQLVCTLHVGHGEDSAVLSLAFKPLKASSMFQTTKSQSKQRLLLVAHGFKGIMAHWDILTQRVVRTHTEQNNEIYAVAYRSDGRMFCSAGKDRCVRVYDARSFELKHTLDASLNMHASAHVNRVFTVKFHPTDHNIILSSGWDCNCQIWNLTQGASVKNLHGPYICGDSLDIDSVKGDVIITGSWRPHNQLQFWAYPSGKLIKTMPFQDEHQGDGKPKLNVYVTCFNPECDTIACGGSGDKGLKILDRYDGRILGKLTGLAKGIYTADFSPTESVLACAGGEGVIYLMQKSLNLNLNTLRAQETQSDVI